MYEVVSDPACLWHQRLVHLSERGLKVLVDHNLLPCLKTQHFNFCKYCMFGKQTRQTFKTGKHINKGILDYIHSYVWGPSPTVSFGGSLYFVTFIDDFASKVWIYLLKRKDNVFNSFKQFRSFVERALIDQLSVLEYIMVVSSHLRSFKIIAKKLGSKGIKPRSTLFNKMVSLNT